MKTMTKAEKKVEKLNQLYRFYKKISKIKEDSGMKESRKLKK